MRSTLATFVLTGFVYAAWATSIPAVAERLALSATALAVVLLAIEAGALAGLPAGAALTGRLGVRRATRIGFAGFTGGLAAAGVAPTAPLLGAAVLVMAGANSVVDVAMNAEGAALERRAGRPVLSRLHAGHSAGVLAGGGCGTLAAALGAGPPVHLAVVAAIALTGAQCAVRGLGTTTEARSAGGKERAGVKALGAIAFCAFLAEGIAANWCGVHLRRVHGASPELAAAAFTGFALALTAGRMAGDRIVARGGRRRTIRAAALVAAAGGALAVLAPGSAGALAGWALVGLGVAPVAPAVLGAAAAARPAAPARAVAAVSSLGYAGAFAGPPAVGGLAAAIGLSAAPGAVAVVALAAGALGGRCPQPESKLRPPASR